MAIKLKTEDLRTILSKVQKGMGHGKILPITDYIEMVCEEGKLSVTSTDLINWVTFNMNVEAEDFKIIVQGEQLAKLIAKTSVPEVEISFDKNNNMILKGNGKYTLEVLEEEFPTFDMEIVEGKEPYKVAVADLKNAFKIGSSSIAVDMIMPCLMGYKLGKETCATNSVKMSVNKVELFGEDILVSQDLANLIDILDDEFVFIDINDGKLLLTTRNLCVFGPAMDGIEDYPDLTEIMQIEFPYSSRFNTKHLKEALERLDIFKDKLKVNGVRITFNKNFITLTDLEGKNAENINYTKKVTAAPEGYNVELNLNYLLDLVSVIPNETIDIYYGDDNCIKIEAESLINFLCVLEAE